MEINVVFAVAVAGAIVSAAVAIGVVSARRVALKKKTAIDLLLILRTDSDFLGNQETFRKASANNDLLNILSPHKEEDGFKKKLAIQNFLNIHELISTAIREETADERICKVLIGDSFVRRWNESKALVETLRKQDKNNTYFTEFQFVAEAWEKNERCIRHHSMWSVFHDVQTRHKNSG